MVHAEWDGEIMTSPEEFRKYAEECLRWARETEDEELRRQFLDMAKTWVAASLQDGTLPLAPLS